MRAVVLSTVKFVALAWSGVRQLWYSVVMAALNICMFVQAAEKVVQLEL